MVGGARGGGAAAASRLGEPVRGRGVIAHGFTSQLGKSKKRKKRKDYASQKGRVCYGQVARVTGPFRDLTVPEVY
eukprot:1158713-Pelagomonas_calceolata.AAC.4